MGQMMPVTPSSFRCWASTSTRSLPYLLAFVYGYLGDHDLLAVRTEAEKYLMLATLNLVECVAFVGSGAAAK